jgi:hypothetical protein
MLPLDEVISMRLLTVLLVIGVTAANAQSTTNVGANTDCIHRLRLPAYPKLADAARISGTVTATVVLSASGSIEKTVLDMDAASKKTARELFPAAVEKALRASAFRSVCGGKSVTLVFSFVLGEDFDPDKLPQSISFGYPNRFWITVPAKVVQP